MTQPMAGWENYTDPAGNVWPAPIEAPPEVANFIQNVAQKPAAPMGPPAPGANEHAAPGAAPALGSPEGMAAALDAPDIRGAAQRKESGGGAQIPDIMGAASAQPAMISQTTTDKTETTQGVDKASEAGIRSAGEDANRAAQASGDAQAQGVRDQGRLEQTQAQRGYGQGVNEYFQAATALQVQDEIINETSAKLEDTAKFKPDRTALFRGDSGVLFGISAAISAMAGGWLMGQGLTGGKNPYLDAVMRMIDDNARDQVETNSQVYQELTRRLGSAEAAKRELKARMLGAVNDTIEAQARFEKGELVQKGAAGIAAQVLAEQAKNRLDVEKAVAKQTTKTIQSRTQMVPNPAATGGIDMTDSKNMARAERVGMLDSLLREGDSLFQSGELADNTGLVDEAAGSVMRFFRSRSPGQKRVEDFKAALQLINRADWASEPNGQEIQRQLSQIGIPENDAEIPQALTRLRTILNSADPGGRFRMARRAMGDRPAAVETGRTPIVR
jgi:hypothetical protein